MVQDAVTSPPNPATLVQGDEGLAINSTLAVKLSEFVVELPDIESGVEDVAAYLDAVRRSIVARPEWKVVEDIYLATFAYSKLAMWRDLNTIKERGTDHPTVLSRGVPGRGSPKGLDRPKTGLFGRSGE